jgi:ribosome-binding protein aMBF1 (putative translation factor)
MKKSSYMTRAMKAHDPRYASILSKLGYARADSVSAAEKETVEADGLTELRKMYQELVGKRAFNGWDAETLTQKITEAKV